MPVSRWSGGAAATALAALLLLPTQYWAPQCGREPRAPPPPAEPRAAPPPTALAFSDLPSLDLAITVALIVFSVLVYLCEWIQRKLMERRIKKLNEWVSSSARRLRAWEATAAQVEGTLRLVQGAAAEYGVLLFLLLRRHRARAALPPPAAPLDAPLAKRPAPPAQPAPPAPPAQPVLC